jgi:hypothetical protein
VYVPYVERVGRLITSGAVYLFRIVTSFCYYFTFEVVHITVKVDAALRLYTDYRESLGELDVLARDETLVREPPVVLIPLPL